MKSKPTLAFRFPFAFAVVIHIALSVASAGNAFAQVLFFDNFEQFTNGTDLTTTNYTPAAGPVSASVVTWVENGSPTISVTNFPDGIWAFFDNSVITNKDDYRGYLSSVQGNQPLQITWKMWIQATNAGGGAFALSVPTSDPIHNYNPPIAFTDTGTIIALTNGVDVRTPIGNWGPLAGTAMTNTLILDYPNGTFSYSLNGQALATLPLGPYFTNVVDSITFTAIERNPGALGNRFALDDLKVELAASAQPSSFQWARRVASTINPDDELAIGLAMDNATNLYVTGWFDGTNDFGGVTLTNNSGGGQDVFLAEYNSSGVLQWAESGGGSTSNRDAGRGVAVDTNGNVYVSGGFYGPADFGPYSFPAYPYIQFFIAEADHWAEQSVGGDGVYGTGLAVDGAGNCYAIGYADNGATITFGGTNLTSPYSTGYSTFLVKFDAAGDVVWAQLLNSPDACYSTSVTLDGDNNVYVAGNFKTSVSIGATNLTNAGDKDGFVAKFDTAGILQWSRQMSGPSDCGAEATSVDAAGNVYVVGGFGNAAGDSISFGSVTLTNAGGGIPGTGIGDAFLAKYDSVGDLRWARRAGGTNMDAYTGVSTDSKGNIYVGGGIGGIGIPDDFNAVVAEYDNNGVVEWAQSSTGTNGALVFTGPVVDAAGNCYVAGWYQGTVDFGTNVLQPQGYWNFFLAKVTAPGPPTLGITLTNGFAQLSVAGDIGSLFSLQWSPFLSATNTPWQTLTTVTLTNRPQLYLDTNAPTGTNRFYRVGPPAL